MSFFNIVAQSEQSTVVTKYKSTTTRSDAYQSEADLEREFIRLLQEQSYEFLPIHSEEDLIKNLRKKLEELNNYTFSDDEWDRFFAQNLANSNEGIPEKTRKIQEDNVQILKTDGGFTKNITLIDKTNIHNNKLQVINQYVNNDGTVRSLVICTLRLRKILRNTICLGSRVRLSLLSTQVQEGAYI